VLEYISYGGGVQSTAMVLMAIDGKIKKPDLVVFADTGSEMPLTYETVERIAVICEENNLPFFITAASSGSTQGYKLHEWYMNRGTLPMVGVRFCTSKFKIDPVRAFVKTKVDQTKPKPWMNAWLGITSDEKRRATGISHVKYQIISYPLLEISRTECKQYIKKNYPQLNVAKSGCFCCPYARKSHWINLKKNHQNLFDTALEMEEIAKKGGVTRGLFGKSTIDVFNYSHQLTDFGFIINDEGDEGCADWSCFT